MPKRKAVVHAKVANEAIGQRPCDEAPVALDEARRLAGGVSKSRWWDEVRKGRLPQPVYPTPKSPRWYPSEIRAALEATRMLPAEAMERRRHARIAASASA